MHDDCSYPRNSLETIRSEMQSFISHPWAAVAVPSSVNATSRCCWRFCVEPASNQYSGTGVLSLSVDHGAKKGYFRYEGYDVELARNCG
jgi:hypothetical protein